MRLVVDLPIGEVAHPGWAGQGTLSGYRGTWRAFAQKRSGEVDLPQVYVPRVK